MTVTAPSETGPDTVDEALGHLHLAGCKNVAPVLNRVGDKWSMLIGMVLATAAEDVEAVAARLTDAGETVHRIGEIREGERGCTVSGSAGTWAAREAWDATHVA